jgi:transcriptional regulator with XRE-family HTH domain
VPLDETQHALLKSIGAHLKRERERAGLTQEKLAEMTDLNPRTIQKIEAGKLNLLITTVSRLRDALGCEWKQLLGK